MSEKLLNQPRLVKDTKTHRFPKASTTVKAAIRRAEQGAL